MKKYKIISISLLFICFFTFSLNIYTGTRVKVYASELAPELVTSVGEYAVLKGLISAGLSIPPSAIAVAGVGASLIIAREYIRTHPTEWNQIKSDCASGLSATYKLTDSIYQSMKDFVTSMSSSSVGAIGVPIPTDYYGTVIAHSFPSSLTTFISSHSTGYNYYLYRNDYVNSGTSYYQDTIFAVPSSMGYLAFLLAESGTTTIYDNFYLTCSGSNGTIYAWDMCSSTPSGETFTLNYTGTNISFGTLKKTSVTGYSFAPISLYVTTSLSADYTFNNPVTNDRSICIPHTIVENPSSTVVDTEADALDGVTYQDVAKEIPYTGTGTNTGTGTGVLDIPDVSNPDSSITAPDATTGIFSIPILGTIAKLLWNIWKAITGFFDLSVPINLEPLKVAGNTFSNVFPFCLPWDIYRSFSTLNVSSVTPDFSFDLSNLPFASICGVNKIDIDLSGFNVLFAIVKTFELLLFDIGLVMVTRRLIGGDE